MAAQTPTTQEAPDSQTALVFLDQPHAGVFTVKESKKHATKPVTPAIAIATYRVSVTVDRALPEIEANTFQVKVQKGEGPGAEQLGLQDWFPTEPGQQIVLGFNPQRLGNARNAQPLSTGSDVEQTWADCERFYGCLPDGRTPNPKLVAAAITEEPRPRAAFFQLLFRRSPNYCDDPKTCRALGAYLSEPDIPALERRKVVAHFMRRPECRDPEVRRELAGGMLRVAADLGNEGQTASAGAVFKRLDAFYRAPDAEEYSIEAPRLDDRTRESVLILLRAPRVGVDPAARDRIRKWISAEAGG